MAHQPADTKPKAKVIPVPETFSGAFKADIASRDVGADDREGPGALSGEDVQATEQ